MSPRVTLPLVLVRWSWDGGESNGQQCPPVDPRAIFCLQASGMEKIGQMIPLREGRISSEKMQRTGPRVQGTGGSLRFVTGTVSVGPDTAEMPPAMESDI